MNQGVIKKTAAIITSLVLAFGAVAVMPSSVVKDNAIVASAIDRDSCSKVEVNGCRFFYTLKDYNGVRGIVIEDCDILNEACKVDIPAYITHENVSYPVHTLGWSFLFNNDKIKELILPETMKEITSNVLWNSPLEKLVLPDGIEKIGYGFCLGCKNLKPENVIYNGDKLQSVARLTFSGCDGLYNDKGAICLNNWLIRYQPKVSPTEVKIADLGNNGMKIDNVANEAIFANSLTTVDLEGIKSVGETAFANHYLLNTVLNLDPDIDLRKEAFNNTPWMLNNKTNGNGAVVKTDNCALYCEFTDRTGRDTLKVVKAFDYTDTVDIPMSLAVGKIKYSVTDIADNFLMNDENIKNVSFASNVSLIGKNVLRNTSVENISLSNGLRELGAYFAADCPNLEYKNVIFEGLRLEKADCTAFDNSPGMVTSSGSISLGNWLIKYKHKAGANGIKISFLSTTDKGVIEYIADGAINDPDNYMTSVNLEHVKYIGKDNFSKWTKLDTITFDDSVEKVGENCFTETPWFKAEKEKGLAKLGSVLLYYRNDSDTIDMTTEGFAGIKTVNKGAFADCEKAQNLKCSSDCSFDADCFYVDFDKNSTSPKDPLPSKSTYKIKNITLDGKAVKYSKESPAMPDWVRQNFAALEGTEWAKVNTEAKMKTLLEQLSMTNYGASNDKIGTLTKTKEFYNMLKAHEYVSAYEFDEYDEYSSAVASFLCGGKLNSKGYSDLVHYVLECSGVENKSLASPNHSWSSTKIGDEWFEIDTCLDAMNGHGYGWLGLSTAKIRAMDDADASVDHRFSYAADKWHDFNGTFTSNIRPDANRILGDINGDSVRDQKDVDMLWNYINGKGSVDKALGDINFDNVVDVKDAVLLDAFVNHTSVDPKNASTDGLASGFNVAFVNGKDKSSVKYAMTDKDGYIVLPKSMFTAPKGKEFDGWNIGKVGAKVKITDPYTVITPKWKSSGLLGDVDGNNVIDIGDVSMLINHINGVKALDDNAMLRADVNKSKTVDISDASTIINHINGVKAITGTV